MMRRRHVSDVTRMSPSEPCNHVANGALQLDLSTRGLATSGFRRFRAQCQLLISKNTDQAWRLTPMQSGGGVGHANSAVTIYHKFCCKCSHAITNLVSEAPSRGFRF